MKKSLTALSALFIMAGAIVTLENYGIIHGVSAHWPALIAVLGIGFIALFFQTGQEDPARLWLGTFCALLGAFFYYLNFCGWGKISFLWPFFLFIVGFCFLALTLAVKRRVFLYLSLFFLALFFSLCLVFTVSPRLWPVSMIVFGLSLLIITLSAKMKPSGF